MTYVQGAYSITRKFEWDLLKNIENIKKHGVDFNDAKFVFYDENARIVDDPDHSDDEDRFVIMGTDKKLRMLIVCHCYRDDDETIRIISAPKASKNEIKNIGDQS